MEECNIKKAVEKALEMLVEYVNENGGEICGTIVAEEPDGTPHVINIKIE